MVRQIAGVACNKIQFYLISSQTHPSEYPGFCFLSVALLKLPLMKSFETYKQPGTIKGRSNSISDCITFFRSGVF